MHSRPAAAAHEDPHEATASTSAAPRCRKHPHNQQVHDETSKNSITSTKTKTTRQAPPERPQAQARVRAPRTQPARRGRQRGKWVANEHLGFATTKMKTKPAMKTPTARITSTSSKQRAPPMSAIGISPSSRSNTSNQKPWQARVGRKSGRQDESLSQNGFSIYEHIYTYNLIDFDISFFWK